MLQVIVFIDEVKYPRGQGVHEEPETEYVPIGQLEQDERREFPVVVVSVPAGQLVQLVAPVLE